LQIVAQDRQRDEHSEKEDPKELTALEKWKSLANHCSNEASNDML
jgi:hypothetical protein